MRDTEYFIEQLADKMQGVLLLTPSEIEKIIGRRAFISFQERILEPMIDSGEGDEEIFQEFVDIFDRQFLMLDYEDKEKYIRISLERGKSYFINRYFSKEIAKLSEEFNLGANDSGYSKNIEKVESLCKKTRGKARKDIETKIVKSALKMDIRALIFGSQDLDDLIEEHL